MYRISIGLIGMFVSVLLAARSIDLLPDPNAAEVTRRQTVCETLAVKCALDSRQDQNWADAQAFARAIGMRTDTVLSIGVRNTEGELVVDVGDHRGHWENVDATLSTPTQMFAPIARADGTPWARMEVAFAPLPFSGAWRYVGGPLFPLIAFVIIIGTFVSSFYLKSVFRRVDGSNGKVVPQRVKDTLDTLAEGVLVLDRKGAIVLANQAFAKSVGALPDQLRGKKVSDLPWHVGTVEVNQSEHPWVKVLREASPQMGQILALRNGFDEKTLSVNSAPIMGEDGVCRGALATFDDLTQVEKARATAVAASKAKGEFLANVSHEIRTPMNAIIGMTDLVLDGKLSEENRECLGIVGESAHALLGVINDLLDLSKIEAGKFDLDPTDFDLRTVLDDAVQPLAFRAHNKKLELTCDVAADVPRQVFADALRLRQVVVNLVGNAIKFTDKGEIVVRVHIDERHNQHVKLHIEVADTGIGIPADKLQAIFEPFTQADGTTTRRFGGTGLGLTISSHLAELMNGEVWAESDLGHGSVFHFTAKVALASDAGSHWVLPDMAAIRDQPVLVVDDNATIRRVLAEMLTSFAAVPTVAESTDVALNLIQKAIQEGQPYRHILLDADLGGVDGFGLARVITRDRLVDNVIMLLTSADLQRDIELCREIRVGHIRKPVKHADLIRTLRSITDGELPVAADALESKSSPSAQPGSPLRILVVDDNPFNQKVAVMKLQRLGHSVKIAACGNDALQALASATFDVLFTDIQMPDMDGYQLTATVRQLEKTSGRRLPVIAMTAHAMKGTREKCLAAGMDDYISKPIADEELLRVLGQTSASVPASIVESLPIAQQDTLGSDVKHVVFDEAAALERVGGNRDMLLELIEVFYQDGKALMADLDAGIRAGDAVQVRNAAHTIKGMVSFFGSTAAMQAALQLEKAGECNDLSTVMEQFDELDHALSAVGVALGQFQNVPSEKLKGSIKDRALAKMHSFS